MTAMLVHPAIRDEHPECPFCGCGRAATGPTRRRPKLRVVPRAERISIMDWPWDQVYPYYPRATGLRGPQRPTGSLYLRGTERAAMRNGAYVPNVRSDSTAD